jgi:hypothetical protein
MKSFKEFLMEEPPPLDWDREIFNAPFETQLQYALQRAARIGSGGSRVVFEIEYDGRPTALKIAKNPKGLAQNKVESNRAMYTEFPEILIPLIDFDEDSDPPKWIHFEKADPMSSMDFQRIEGYSFKAFGDLILNNTSGMALPNDRLYNTIAESDLFNMVLSFIFDFNIFPEDILLEHNWGIYQGRPVLIDVGLSEDVFVSLYQ